jgi:hypothetical protein
MVLSGFKKPGERMVRMFSLMLDAFNPLGSSSLLQTLTPTVVDPIAALAENKDFTGRNIFKEDFNKMKPTAGWTRTKDTASDFSKAMAYSINYVTGGGKYGIGIASPTPDTIDYLIGQATGGVGRETLKLWQFGKTGASGEEMPMYKVPVAGKFIGETTGQASETSKFYSNLKRIGEHASTIKEIKEAKDAKAYSDYLRENPDARLIQAMTLTLLEAGELSVRPPMLAVQEAIRSDINLIAGGVTWTDAQYDERLGEVLRPLTQDRGGFPAAFRIEESIKFAIADAFYLNKLNLPITGEMTAYEVQQRVQEFIRQTLPLFSPVETEYNAALCDRTFDVLMLFGAFRDMPIPRSLEGQDVQFRFESPLQDATDREKAEQFRAMVAMVGEAAAVDQTVIQVPNFGEALRDAIGGLGAPATWVKSETETAEAVAAAQAQQEEDRAVAQAAELAKMVPKGAGAMANA